MKHVVSCFGVLRTVWTADEEKQVRKKLKANHRHQSQEKEENRQGEMYLNEIEMA